jgi:hypothetical protein
LHEASCYQWIALIIGPALQIGHDDQVDAMSDDSQLINFLAALR